jgi:transcriptional regulator with XRE-family HTH domain
MTLAEAARRARVSSQTVHNWRARPQTATAGPLGTLAKVLGVSVDELLRELREDAKS